MDRLTRNSIIISAILLFLLMISLAWNNDELRPRVWQLNEILKEDPVLSSYPYHFRVLLFLNGVATLSSPDASGAPIQPFLASIDSSLAGKSGDDPAMVVAERHYREVEMRAIALMQMQPDVKSVTWSLDKAWYHKHGVPLPAQ